MIRKLKIWMWEAPLGLIFVGAGISMAIDAGIHKSQDQDWFFYGTFSLVLVNAGLCIFGDAVYRRTKT